MVKGQNCMAGVHSSRLCICLKKGLGFCGILKRRNCYRKYQCEKWQDNACMVL